MDCLCCADGGRGPPSETEFLGSVCHLKTGAVFPAEPGRYTLYVIAGCPFAARPWSVLSFYGIPDSALKIVKLFPAAYQDGWFFSPTSDGEKGLVKSFPDAAWDVADPHHDNVTHIKQLYELAQPGFNGAPLLWDAQTDKPVSNSSLGLAEMIATQLRPILATQNVDVDLFPSRTKSPDEYKEHDDLVKMLHRNVTTAVYRMNVTTCGKEHDRMVDAYYDTLDDLERRLVGRPYLMGNDVRFADLVLFVSLVRLDLAYQWRFGLGRKSVREDYPNLWAYTRRILGLGGIADSVLPRDIMALYFLTLKWVQVGGRTLPQVPQTWSRGCRLDELCDRSSGGETTKEEKDAK